MKADVTAVVRKRRAKPLRQRIDCALRLAGTAISFFVFGLGGLLLRGVVFPLLGLIVRERVLKVRIAREVIRLAFRAFVEMMRLLGVLRYEVSGLERLQRKGLLILANHPTLIDTVFLMAFVKHADCIVKQSLWNHPVTRGPVRSAGYISNANGPGLIGDCIASLTNRGNLIVFPEGTRTPANGVMQFKRGRRNITPVLITCRPPTLRKGEKWWRVPASVPCFSIAVQEDIEIAPFLQNDASEALAARHLTDYLQNYFMKATLGHTAA